MRRLLLTAVLILGTGVAAAQEPVAKSKIVAAGLFKNGLAVIKREVVLPGAGTYRLEELPDPVHGTWWVESATPVETSVKTREVLVPADGDTHFQDNLAGSTATVHFKGGKPEPVSGTVLKTAGKGEAGQFLVLKTAKSRLFIDPGQIAMVEADGNDAPTRKMNRPVLLLAGPGARPNEKIMVTYLTHGLAWVPSYRVDITDPKKLSIELATVVKNDLEGLVDADLRLISGFSSVEFAHVSSPLSPKQTWESFIQQLQGDTPAKYTFSSVANSISLPSNFRRAGDAIDIGATPRGEGVDLHFQPIGKRTLAKGEALSLSIAKETAPYERIVEWLIPDKETDAEVEDTWDALRFKNPFKFPMTTGPAMITADGQFNGQRTSKYVSSGEQTHLRVTKSLSVRTRHSEREVAGKNGDREYIWLGGSRYRKSTVAAELLVSNHRQEDVKVVIQRRFSGELLTADGGPRTTLREEGVHSINRRNELVWVVELKAGAERRLTYQYSVLVAQ
jgi:hypothetical protein